MAESLWTDCEQYLSSTSSSIIYPRREQATRSMLIIHPSGRQPATCKTILCCSAFILYLATSLILGSATVLFATLIWYYELVLEMIAVVYCSIEQSPLRNLAVISYKHRPTRNTRVADSMLLDDDVPGHKLVM